MAHLSWLNILTVIIITTVCKSIADCSVVIVLSLDD